jgi:two-component system, OmpR family, sensor kinase
MSEVPIRTQDRRPTGVPEGFFRELQVEFLVHELKDPLSVIETGVRTLLERQDKYGALSRRQERTLQRTLRGARKARGMLNSLLEVGRSEAGCFSCGRFPLSRTVATVLVDTIEIMDHSILEGVRDGEDTLKSLARCGITLEIDPKIEDEVMFQDEIKFTQIVGNLIKNALHYRQKHVHIVVRIEGQHVSIDVTDDGPGIRPEHHEFIFHRYAQVHDSSDVTRGGHGLGLAGSRILARHLGGDLLVSSDKGKGATFRLVLPRSLDGAQDA